MNSAEFLLKLENELKGKLSAADIKDALDYYSEILTEKDIKESPEEIAEKLIKENEVPVRTLRHTIRGGWGRLFREGFRNPLKALVSLLYLLFIALISFLFVFVSFLLVVHIYVDMNTILIGKSSAILISGFLCLFVLLYCMILRHSPYLVIWIIKGGKR